MQFQADLSGHKIIKTDTIEITATGTAYIAGIASGSQYGEPSPVNAGTRYELEFLAFSAINTHTAFSINNVKAFKIVMVM